MILIDKVTFVQGLNSTAFSFNHGVSSADAVLLLVIDQAGTGGGVAPTSVQFNGINMSLQASALLGTTNTAQIYYLINPPVGTYTFTITWLSTTNGPNFTGMTLLGVDKKTPNLISASGTASAATTISNNVTPTAPNSLIIEVFNATAGSAFTTTSPQVTIYSVAANANQASYLVTDNTLTNINHSWTTATTAVQAMVALNPAQAPSDWYPNVGLRSITDVVQNKLGGARTVGYIPSNFFLNSFLHTIGRQVQPFVAPVIVPATPAMSTLQDAFHANQLDTNTWSLFTAGGASFVTNPTGAGTVYPASTTSSTDGDISSINAYDLTGSYAFVRIVQPLSLQAGSSDTTFSVRTTGVNSLQFQIEGGTLFAQHIVAGAQSNLKNIPYSGVQHAWLRIREQAGRVYWETSQDGPNGPTGWSWFWDEPNPINVTSLKVLLAGTSFGVDTNPGQFIFDNLNTLPVGIFDQFNFQPSNPTFYSGELWYAVGRLLPQATTTPPTLVAETELQTSQTVVDRITQQAVVSGTSVTSDHLVSSQDTVMLIFASQMGVAQALNSVTLNGVALTPLGNPSVSTLTAGAYYVVNPNVGINVISASATLPTALELIVMTLIGVDKKTTTPVIVANTGALGSPSTNITPASANALLIDYVGSLGTSISENASQTVYFDQPQAASQAAGSIKLSTAGQQTMSWTTLSSAWVQLVVALEPANALSMWFPAIDLRNLSDVIPVNNDDASNPVGAFYGTDGNFPTQYWQNSFLHTIGRLPTANTTPAPVVTSGGTLMLMGIG